jgi:energy-coupling factor transport system permease protein
MKAQSSRGVDFNKGGLIKKFKAVISLIIPLLISSFKRSEELSNAMEARGYDPDKKRSRYRTLSFTYRDLIALLVVLIYFAGFLSLCIFNYNGYEINIIKFIFNVETIF